MLIAYMLAGAVAFSPAVSVAPIITEARFVEELEHADLSYLKDTSVSIMGDSISTWTGKSIEGGSEAVYPDSEVQSYEQMWFGNLNVQQLSSVAGSYVTHREDGEFVNFNSDTRVGFLGDSSTVIIYGGTCDLLANVSVSDFESSLESLVSNVQYGDMRATVLCTLPPIDHINQDGDTYKEFNDSIRAVADRTGSVLCEFEDAWEFSEISQFTEDGVHPNAAGMARLSSVFD